MTNKKELVKLKDSDFEEVPTCLYWSLDEVADFIDDLGFTDYRECFTSNFIDGRKLFLMNGSNLPKIGITKYEDIKIITDAIKHELKMEEPNYFRKIYMPPFNDQGLYLEAKTRTGKLIDDICFEEFREKCSGKIWQPPLANEALLMPR